MQSDPRIGDFLNELIFIGYDAGGADSIGIRSV